MNRTARACTIAALLAAMSATVQASPKEPSGTQPQRQEADTDKAVDAIRDYSVERRDEAVAAARDLNDRMDRRIEALQAEFNQRWDRMGSSARARTQQTISDLRRRRNDVAEWYGGMRHSSGGAWAEVRGGFVQSYRDLAEAMRRARAEFDNDQAQPEENKPSKEAPKPASH